MLHIISLLNIDVCFPCQADETDHLCYTVSQWSRTESDIDDERQQGQNRPVEKMSSVKQDQSPRHSCECITFRPNTKSWHEDDVFD